MKSTRHSFIFLLIVLGVHLPLLAQWSNDPSADTPISTAANAQYYPTITN